MMMKKGNDSSLDRMATAWNRFLNRIGLIRKETHEIQTELEHRREAMEIKRIQNQIKK